MKNVIKTIFLIFLIVSLSACSTLHTGPLLGDIPLSFGRMNSGDVYVDKKRRFIATCPISNAEVKKGAYGVSFLYAGGMSSYGIFAYEPEGLSEFEFTLENMLLGIKNMLKSREIEISIYREEYGNYRDYQSIDFDFSIPEIQGNAPRIYVSKLIKAGNYIYWMNYSTVVFPDATGFREKHFYNAHQFFNNVRFENEVQQSAAKFSES